MAVCRFSRGLMAAAMSVSLLVAACSSAGDGGKLPPGAASSIGGAPAASSGGSADESAGIAPRSGVRLQMLIDSSGPAETTFVQTAAKEWESRTGNTVSVVAAKDLARQLNQRLAGDSPPDVFYVDAGAFASLAKAKLLAPIGNQLTGKDDFYPALVKTFTYEKTFYCAPKDFSTLGLQVNTDMLSKAGLTEADVPKTWGELEQVAKRLSTGGRTGLVVGDTRDRIGVFLKQAGGWIVDEDATRVTADTPENLRALEFVQKLLTEGAAKYPKQVDASWSGEALGKQKAAMVIEGNWVQAAMKSDHPNVKYKTYELPRGPQGKGTLAYARCYGIAAQSKNQDVATNLVNFLTMPERQLEAAGAFGSMPSRRSARAQFESRFPQSKAFLAGIDYAQGPVPVAEFDTTLAEFDFGLLGLSDGSTDPKKLLESLQQNGSDVLAGG